jgi:hypothetical protein
VEGALLPQTLIDRGSGLNIIFVETLKKMDFDFKRLTACDEPFFGIIPGKAAYPMGQIFLPVTFGVEDNFRVEYLNFEVADFKSSYQAIRGRPMLARFMAVPHYTYLVLKMTAPKGVLCIYGDLIVPFKCDNEAPDIATMNCCVDTSAVRIALGHFISKLGEKGLPFFKLLKKLDKFVWTDEADQELEELKTFLTAPPVMVPLAPKEILLLYISASTQLVGVVLVAERPEESQPYPVQQPIYYVSEVCSDSKIRFSQLQRYYTPSPSPHTSSDTTSSRTRSRSSQSSPWERSYATATPQGASSSGRSS